MRGNSLRSWEAQSAHLPTALQMCHGTAAAALVCVRECPHGREPSALSFAPLERRGFGAPYAHLCGGPLCWVTLPRAPATAAARPGLVCCGARACLSVSQSLAVRLLARDSQALQLKPSCLWFSGCVSGTRLSLKPLIYHLENNQICPGAPLHLPFPRPLLLPLVPRSPSPAYSFHRIIIIHFFPFL